jgi:hypothetical protein
LQSWTPGRGLQKHQRGGRLGTSQYKTKSTLGPMQQNCPWFGQKSTEIHWVLSFIFGGKFEKKSYFFLILGAVALLNCVGAC